MYKPKYNINTEATLSFKRPTPNRSHSVSWNRFLWKTKRSIKEKISSVIKCIKTPLIKKRVSPEEQVLKILSKVCLGISKRERRRMMELIKEAEALKNMNINKPSRSRSTNKKRKRLEKPQESYKRRISISPQKSYGRGMTLKSQKSYGRRNPPKIPRHALEPKDREEIFYKDTKRLRLQKEPVTTNDVMENKVIQECLVNHWEIPGIFKNYKIWRYISDFANQKLKQGDNRLVESIRFQKENTRTNRNRLIDIFAEFDFYNKIQCLIENMRNNPTMTQRLDKTSETTRKMIYYSARR